jgi:hypothetical protein
LNSTITLASYASVDSTSSFFANVNLKFFYGEFRKIFTAPDSILPEMPQNRISEKYFLFTHLPKTHRRSPRLGIYLCHHPGIQKSNKMNA